MTWTEFPQNEGTRREFGPSTWLLRVPGGGSLLSVATAERGVQCRRRAGHGGNTAHTGCRGPRGWSRN